MAPSCSGLFSMLVGHTQAHDGTGRAAAASALVVSVDRYGTGVDPSKRSAPGFAVSGDGGVDPVALRPSHPAQRAGRGDQGRTADGTTRAAARCRSRHLHGRREAHRRQRPACQMRAISTVFSTHLVCHRTSSRREESMVPGATSAKEGARVGVAHPSVTETVCFNRSDGLLGHALLLW